MHRIRCFYSVVGHAEDHDIVILFFFFFFLKTKHLKKLCIYLRGGAIGGGVIKNDFYGYTDFGFLCCDQCVFSKTHGDYLTGQVLIY